MRFEFDHVHLNSSDAKGAADFYVEKFDGKRVGEVEVAGTQMVIVDFGGTRFLINERPPGAPPAGSSVDHIGFRVADVEAAAEELKRRGAEFLMEPVSLGEGVTIAFVTGPDGVMIELSQEGGRV
ncbi:MAG: VOC family protein [Candidatus Abyssobacteria bacterium SURF_17]|jgi:methylmalonyl-CoA/ethylmalonyl-CoA epimerase|uniref:VOC family protein n=1 Tax=Candidatus Abyssobacteria bacterium SURF_17 TaxID=2093361 RepID=A0A419F7Q6_9BACT|nr:MAG: VOC family protein [Candidatus Abyssubacteria bacterium SURF_17]